jgi:site-specific DNA-cytosine methylase
MNKPLFPYEWYLKDGYPAPNIEKHGLKVYTTFSCGGGSSMGYKLAGYEVIGANDIDPQMAKVYKENHKPRFYDLCPIGELLEKDLPAEYYDLDILDGSPPCSTFSMAGSREKAFKKDKVFREGQAKQVLSDLFFDWIKLVDKLKPKVAIAENVKGMLAGNAKAYTSTVLRELDKIGYDVHNKDSRFTTKLIHKDKVCFTIIASDNNILYSQPRHLSVNEVMQIGSFPLDYSFLDIQPKYLIGMSVPPVMTAQVAYQVYLQLFKNNKLN